MASGWGAQAVGVAGDEVVMAARLLRIVVAPIWVNLPPTYSVPPLTANAFTPPPMPLTFGFHNTTVAAVVASTAPRLLRENPPSPVKVPPTSSVEPSRARALTPPPVTSLVHP